MNSVRITLQQKVVFVIPGESASGADDWAEYEELSLTSGRDSYDAFHDFQFVSNEAYIIELCVCSTKSFTFQFFQNFNIFSYAKYWSIPDLVEMG